MSRKFCVAVILMIMSFSISTAQNGTISCVGNFNLSLNACSTEITPSMIAAGTLPLAQSAYTVTLKDPHGNMLPDAFVNGEHKGKEITYTLTDNTTGNSCWGVMLIEDKIAPTIIGCASGEVSIENVGCFSYTRLDLAMAELAEDNCDPNPELIILDEYLEEELCEDRKLKTIVRNVKAVDNCGNESDPCTIKVTLERLIFKLADFDDPFPTGFVIPQDTIIDCGLVNGDVHPDNLDFNNNPNPIELSGVPTYYVNSEIQYSLFPLDEMAHCKLNVVYQDSVLVRDACFTKIVRYWTILEGCLSDAQEETYIQQITIMDLEAPVMTNVPNKLNFSTNSAAEDICVARTPIPIPTLTDNCQADEDLILFVVINGQLPQIEYTGQALDFPDGLSHLVYIATDACFNGSPEVQELNETRDTVEVWVEDNAPPVCEIDDKAITINNDTGEVKVKAEVFDEGSYDDCSNKVKIFAKRDDDGTICPCAPEDALDRYTGFIYLGRRDGHDYYLSEDAVIGPKAFNIAVAMGGYVVEYEKAAERVWLKSQVEEYRANTNPLLDVVQYTVTGPDGVGQSSQGWDSASSNGFFMEATDSERRRKYDGLTIEKQFVLEVDDLCGYSEVVRFCCLDVIDGAPVTFRTMDKWGNFNECDLVVDIQDKVAPLIQCPPADTIVCSDYSEMIDLSQFGAPTSIDACPAIITELDPAFDISPCHTGTITRTFEIRSGNGTQMCEQVVVVEAIPAEDFEDPIDPKDIYLPRDAEMLGIGANALTCFEDTSLLKPDGLPAMFLPQFVDNRSCSDLWIGYTDDVFEVPEAGPNTCFKIVRHWTILDDCDMDNPIVLYEYDQSIIITNNDAPTIDIIALDMACNNDGPDDCEMEGRLPLRATFTDQCTDTPDIRWSYQFDYNCDGVLTDPVMGTGNLAINNSHPIGSHKFILSATDNCNNTTTQIHEFTIKLCVSPIAACQALTMPLHCFPDPPTSPTQNGNAVSLSQTDCDADGIDDDVYVFMCSQADWFAPIKGDSYHPCDIPVVYSFSPDTTDVERCFTCEDLKCPQEVQIFITDEFGNSDSCVTTMTLTDPKMLCPAIQSCFVPPNVTTITLDTICIAGALPGNLREFGIIAPSINTNCCNENNDISFVDTELSDDDNGCRRVRRTWTLSTDCGCPETETFVQVIKIRNNDAPELNCPAAVDVDVNVSASSTRDCGANVNLPAATVDNCQTNDLVITNDYLVADGADLRNIYFPIGNTFVSYSATNVCGLTDNCRVRVRVRDRAAPVCNITAAVGPITVGLEGVSFTDQQILDRIFALAGNTVSDNCDSLRFVADPPNLACTDLGANGMGTFNVMFTVTDEANNSTDCTASITLQEAGQPAITCPPDRQDIELNASCQRVVPNYIGQVDIMNTCTSNITVGGVTQSPAPGTMISEVSTQTITMSATTSNGQTLTCSFNVNFVDNRPPSITCPNRAVSAALDDNCRPRVPDLRVARDNCREALPPRNNNSVVVNNIGVYQIPRQGSIWDMSSEVLIVAVDASGNRDSCMVALTAACPGQDNAPSFNQRLPDLSTDSSNECEATIIVPFMVDYCLPTNLVYTVSATGPNVNDVDLTVTSTGVNGTVPTGTHVITVTASDPMCNLSVSESFNVTVVATGGSPATYECKKIVKSIQDGAVPSVTFRADEIVCVEGGVSCDGSNPTIFGSFSSDPLDQTRTYVCGDLGDIQLTMFIHDVADVDGDGDLDTTFREPCFAVQTVVDQSGFCQFFRAEESNVEGRIRTEDGGGIENTSVALIGIDNTQEFMTEEHGLYAFPSMPMGGQYTVKPSKEGNYSNGLSTLDIILMQKHILGIIPFESPYKIIASDVNSSGTISALDLVEMRKVILSIKDGFDNTPAWKMVDASYQFVDIDNPLSEGYPEAYAINDLDKHMAIDFIGIKMGDVNLSADPSNMVKAETRTSATSLDFTINPLVNGDQVRFDFSSANFIDIEGFQFTLNFDPAELTFTDLNASILDMKRDNLGLTKSKDGFITVSYDKIGGVTTSREELLFSLVFTHKGELNHKVSTSSSVLAAQAYSTTDVFDLSSELTYGETDIKLYQNTPNPWQETTDISFMLPVDMTYEMRFFTVSGELIHALKADGKGGLNTINMQRDQLAAKGLIYYELITAHEKTTKRMILIR